MPYYKCVLDTDEKVSPTLVGRFENESSVRIRFAQALAIHNEVDSETAQEFAEKATVIKITESLFFRAKFLYRLARS